MFTIISSMNSQATSAEGPTEAAMREVVRYPRVNIETDVENPLGKPSKMIYKWSAFHIFLILFVCLREGNP